MATGWSIEIGNEAGALTDYGNPMDLNFVKRQNSLGYHNCLLPGLGGLAEPTQGQVVRYVWDRGLGSERAHFEGYIQDIRRHQNSKMYVLRGFDILGKLWQSSLGSFRDYVDLTPHAIAQGAGSPNNLLKNAQGNQVMTYGSDAAVPNKVDGGNPGTALKFRADSGKMLLNFQRLAMQARYDGASYGLEFFAKFEGANKSDPRFYLVKRRTRAAAYTPETWNIPQDLIESWRGREGSTGAHVVEVVGSGDGQTRVQSALIGSGSGIIEGVIADKTALETTNATNHANRLSELLDPTREVVTGRLWRHKHVTEVGDDVIITETGIANYQPRVYEIGYRLKARSFFITAGRPRPMSESPLAEVFALVESQAQGPQRVTVQKVNNTFPTVFAGTLADGASAPLLTLSFSAGVDYREFRDEGLEFFLEIKTFRAAAANPAQFDVRANLVHDGGNIDLLQGRYHADLFAAGPPLEYRIRFPFTFHKGVLDDVTTPSAMTHAQSINVTLTNRSGAQLDDTTAKLYGWLLG